MPDNPNIEDATEGIAVFMDHVNASLEYATAIQTTPFEQITPEIWGAVQQGASGLTELLNMMRMTLSASVAILDDPELFARSQEVVAPHFPQ